MSLRLDAMSELVVTVPDAEFEAALGEVSGVQVIRWDMSGDARQDRLDIVVPPYLGGNEPLTRLRRTETRLVQWQSIGFDGVTEYLPEGQPFANAATVHETSTAELAVGLAIAGQRGFQDFVRAGDEGRWLVGSRPSLADRRVLLVGYGGVSKAIEARLAGFEVEIARVASRPRTEQNLAGASVHVHGIDELHEQLAEAEVVIIAVPLSDATRGLFDAAALAALPDDALVVNVARGPVVVTDALVAELQSGRLRAALDVTDPEPLPEDHPLWSCPNTLITPHVGGDSSAMLPRMVALLKRQIAHLKAGETPENLVLGEWDE